MLPPLSRLAASGLALALASWAGQVDARSFRVADVPNGEDRECRTCHGDDSGATRNKFGSEAQGYLVGPGLVQEDNVDWGPLCSKDSDGDGWTNGYELGDPDCIWTKGATPTRNNSYNPGDAKSHPPPICHNGRLDAGEPCEDGEMGKTECSEEGAGTGKLGCNPEDCTFDYSNCSYPPGGRGDEGDPLDGEGCRSGAGTTPGAAAAIAAAAMLLASRRRAGPQR